MLHVRRQHPWYFMFGYRAGACSAGDFCIDPENKAIGTVSLIKRPAIPT